MLEQLYQYQEMALRTVFAGSSEEVITQTVSARFTCSIFLVHCDVFLVLVRNLPATLTGIVVTKFSHGCGHYQVICFVALADSERI